MHEGGPAEGHAVAKAVKGDHLEGEKTDAGDAGKTFSTCCRDLYMQPSIPYPPFLLCLSVLIHYTNDPTLTFIDQ